jgi:hypothetical protein
MKGGRPRVPRCKKETVTGETVARDNSGRQTVTRQIGPTR